MSQTPIRVLIVDDHAIVRKGLRALLTEIDDIEAVGEAGDGQEAITQAESTRPDVILMDIVMPTMDGVAVTRRIREQQPEARILALTSFAADDKLFPAIKAGALGYLLKDSDPEDLVEAIREVHRGEPSLHPRIARKVLRELGRPSPQPKTPDPLTERELEVLRLVAKGLDNQQIADALTIAEVAVSRRHRPGNGVRALTELDVPYAFAGRVKEGQGVYVSRDGEKEHYAEIRCEAD